MTDFDNEAFYNYMRDNNLDVDDMAGLFNGVLDYIDKAETERKKAEEEKRRAEDLHAQKCEDMTYLIEDFYNFIKNYYPNIVNKTPTPREFEEAAKDIVLTMDNIAREIEALQSLDISEKTKDTIDRITSYLKADRPQAFNVKNPFKN